MAEGKETDYIDIASLIGSIVMTATAWSATASLFWALPIFVAHYTVKAVRRSEWARKLAEEVTTGYPRLQAAAPILLPGPSDTKETTFTLTQNKPLDVRVVDPYENEPFWKQVTRPLPSQTFSGTATPVERKRTQLVNSQDAFLQKSLKRLPAYINYQDLPKPPSKLAVPIGMESIDGTILWGDFSTNGNLIHALVAGQTGTGKDALLRLWFSTLTIQNTPDEIQFVILDGKGVDWLSPAIAESAYMATKPAGGLMIQKQGKKYVNIAEEAMAENLNWIFDEMLRRSDLMNACGAVDLVSYRKRTGKHLPYIFVLASDVGDTFNDGLETLVKWLITRGRSFGIRLIINMQNPVGEDTKWRSQIGLVMSGYQQNPDHDRYILGINVDRMLVRPSQLPNPEESDISKGLFVARLGSQQHLVRTAHLPEDDWYRYIEQILPKKRDVEDRNLLTALLTAQEEKQTRPLTAVQPTMQSTIQQVKKPALTNDQIKLIRDWTIAGKNKTEIMVEGLKFSNGDVYKAKSAAVSIIINAVKRNAVH